MKILKKNMEIKKIKKNEKKLDVFFRLSQILSHSYIIKQILQNKKAWIYKRRLDTKDC